MPEFRDQLRVYPMSHHNPHDEVKTLSETFDCNSILTQMITQEDFISVNTIQNLTEVHILLLGGIFILKEDSIFSVVLENLLARYIVCW